MALQRAGGLRRKRFRSARRMIRRSIREWEYLDVSDVGADSAVTRAQADRLLAVARVAQASLRPGGSESERILVDGRKRLRAQQVVGVLTVPGVFLEILPKIDGLDEGATRANLVHMLARIFTLKIADGALAPLGWQRQDLLEILIRLFCDKLFAAVHRGLSRGYIPQEGDLSVLRGRLDLKRQFTVLAASPQQLACR